MIDFEQARIEAVATATALVPGAAPMSTAIMTGTTLGSAAVDVSQGQYTEAMAGMVPGAGGALVTKVGAKMAPVLLKSAGDELAEAAARAAKANPGSGAVRGTHVHSDFADEAKAMGFGSEVSYKGGEFVEYGKPQSIRADVVIGPAKTPQAIFDLKTGSATLSPAREAQIRRNLPAGHQDIPIIPINVP